MYPGLRCGVRAMIIGSKFEPIRLVIYGKPAPQGSKVPTIVRLKGGGVRPGMRETQGGWTMWRPRVHDEASRFVRCQCPDPDCNAVQLPYPLDRPVEARMFFYFERPAGHFKPATKARQALTVLREDAPMVPANRTTGDVEKLARAISDGLESARLLADDGLITREVTERIYCGPHTEMRQAGAIVWILPYEMRGPIDPRYPDQLGNDTTIPAEPGSLFEVNQ